MTPARKEIIWGGMLFMCELRLTCVRYALTVCGIGTLGDTQMTNTYETIRALPGKSTNWRNLVDVLAANYLTVYAQAHNGAAPWAGNTTAAWSAASGVRALRQAAWEAAAFTVDAASRCSRFIPPSPETLAWGGFLGGETVVWTDRDAEDAATAAVCELIASAV